MQVARLAEAVARAREGREVLREGLDSDKKLEHKPSATLIDRALEAGVISAEERSLLDEAEVARAEAVAVDAFKPVEYAEMMF